MTSERRPYRAPALSEYGDVAELTLKPPIGPPPGKVPSGDDVWAFRGRIESIDGPANPR